MATLAHMVGGLMADRNPWDLVPKRYHPPAPAAPPPKVMTPEEAAADRAARLEIGLANLGAMLRRR